MTLVAALYLYEVPVLIGDVILSQTGVSGEHRHVPTRTDVAEVLPHEWLRRISGLKRKVATLHGRLVVGWAGHEVVAHDVVARLRAHYRDREPDRADLAAFLESYPEAGRGIECTLIGWLVDEHGLTSFVWDSTSKKFEADGTEKNRAVGSGAKDLYDLVRKSQTYHLGNQTSEEKAVASAVGLAAQVIGEELISGRTLQGLYGGAIEVLYLSEGRFVALEDVTFLFFGVEIDPARDQLKCTLAPLMMKYQYAGESLCIYTMRFDKSLSAFPTSREVDVVSVVDKSAAVFTPPEMFPMDARFYCSFVTAFIHGHGVIKTAVVLPHEPGGSIEIVRARATSGQDEQLSFTVREGFLQLVYNFLMAMVSRPNDRARPREQ